MIETLILLGLFIILSFATGGLKFNVYWEKYKCKNDDEDDEDNADDM